MRQTLILKLDRKEQWHSSGGGGEGKKLSLTLVIKIVKTLVYIIPSYISGRERSRGWEEEERGTSQNLALMSDPGSHMRASESGSWPFKSPQTPEVVQV